MKNLYTLFLIMSLGLVVITGCESEEMNHTEVSAVNNLYAPEDNAYLNLSGQSSALFEWEAAKAEDNGVVLYEVLFDQADGDFSDAVYSLPSDGNGLQRTLNISFGELSRIAGMAGIQPAESGTLKWTVQSSKGLNIQPSATSRVIQLERPAGFPTPAEFFIVGSATEVGDDIGNAIQMKRTSTNTFEVYTSLAAGEYYFAEGTTSSAATYSITNEKLVSGGTNVVEGESGVYRIRVDFSNATTEMAQIQSVGLWFAPDDEFWFEIPYQGNGTWLIEDAPIEFKQEDWGRDERYKFRFTVEGENGTADEWFGSTNADNQRPNDSTGDEYWYMVPVSNDRWNNSFKFNENVDNNNADIAVIFNASVSNYTHTVTPK